MGRRYDKLVRDRIPKIVEENGERPVIRVADDEEYANRLRDKLLEEVDEYREEGAIDDLADVLEVVADIAAHEGFTREELDSSLWVRVASGKRERRAALRIESCSIASKTSGYECREGPASSAS